MAAENQEQAAPEVSENGAVEKQQEDLAARIEEIFRGFEALRPAAGTASCTLLFELTGQFGGRHLLAISDRGVRWQPEPEGGVEPDVVVRLAAEDFVAIADGSFRARLEELAGRSESGPAGGSRSDGHLAVASERMEISGNLELAEELLSWLQPPDA
ncbi:MAG: hypothetical protein D6815_10415 [Candidatus Dadabacteria bacterium]|nr:MAG: hypothetical protein D6815_10415 [Candidatus Dadabacteria bacterium]